MSLFNQYGNIEDPTTKEAVEQIHKICRTECKRLLEAGASINDVKAVTRDMISNLDVACGQVVLQKQFEMKKTERENHDHRS